MVSILQHNTRMANRSASSSRATRLASKCWTIVTALDRLSTASGTTIFKDVPVEGNQFVPVTERFRYSNPFYQLKTPCDARGHWSGCSQPRGMAVKERTRVFSHGNASSVAADPQILQVVGRVRGNSYAAGAIVLKVAEALQRAHEAQLSGDEENTVAAIAIAKIELEIRPSRLFRTSFWAADTDSLRCALRRLVHRATPGTRSPLAKCAHHRDPQPARLSGSHRRRFRRQRNAAVRPIPDRNAESGGVRNKPVSRRYARKCLPIQGQY